MDYKQAAREWSQGIFRPIYVLFGTETFIMREWIDLLVSKAVEPSTRDFTLSRYDLSETPLEVVLEDARTPAFLATRKLVIASNAQFLTGEKDTSKVVHHTEALIEYILNPAEDVTLVLYTSVDKLDERKKVVKNAKHSAVTLSFPKLKFDELSQWIQKKATAKGVVIETDAVAMLIERVGTQCALLASEIEKCALFVGHGETIRKETIEALTIRATEEDIFDLIRAITNKHAEQAMTLFHHLLNKKEEPIKVLMMLARQFRLIIHVYELNKRGFSQTQMVATLRSHPYPVQLASAQAKRFDIETLMDVMNELAQLDMAIKTGTIDKVLGIELFILRFSAIKTTLQRVE